MIQTNSKNAVIAGGKTYRNIALLISCYLRARFAYLFEPVMAYLL